MGGNWKRGGNEGRTAYPRPLTAHPVVSPCDSTGLFPFSHNLSKFQENGGCKHPSKHRIRGGELPHPLAGTLRNPHNLGVVLQLGKHLLGGKGRVEDRLSLL